MSQTGRPDAWQHAESRKERIGESKLLLRFFVFFLRQGEPKDGGVFRREPGIDMGEPHETAREQSGAAQEHKRECDLDNNERAPQPTARVSRSTRALFQAFLHVGMSGEQGRRDAEHNPGQRAEAK